MNTHRLVPILSATLVTSLLVAEDARAQGTDVPILTTAIEYLEDRFPEGPRALVYGLELQEAAAQALATRFGASVVRAEDPVACTGAPRGCSLINDNPTVIEAKVTERTGDSAVAEVKLYREFGGEVAYHFVRLRLSRSAASWEIVEVLAEIIT